MIPVDKSMSFFLKQRQRYLRNSKHSSQMAIDTPYKKLPQNVNNTVKWKKLVKVDNLISELILLSKVRRAFPNH